MATTVFHIIPVLDLKGGRAVHAKGGRRDHYRPIQSVLHAGSDVVALGQVIRWGLGLKTLYLADLDAIAGSPPSLEVYERLLALDLCVWIDCGLADTMSIRAMLELEHSALTFVAGLETLCGVHGLSGIVRRAGPERVIFSLDLFNGRPLTPHRAVWTGTEPFELAQEAIGAGVRRLVLLDLARVGEGSGTGTLDLVARIRAAFPEIEIFVGGGLGGLDAILELREMGVAGVLLGSALHDGTIGPRELEQFGS